jgi:hypothetical protein
MMSSCQKTEGGTTKRVKQRRDTKYGAGLLGQVRRLVHRLGHLAAEQRRHTEHGRACSYPSVNEPFPNLNTPYETDFKACRNLNDCVKAMSQPMRWAGRAIFENIRKHANERATGN